VCDLRDTTAMCVGEVLPRALRIARSAVKIIEATRSRRPRAALLVNYTEFNARLAPLLHRAGIRILWYVAPQIWAWRSYRARTLRRHIDRMAVILPFEEELWRMAGVDAHYVGHPVREVTLLPRGIARQAVGLTPYASAVAILPGSRPHEVRRLLKPMLEAYEPVRFDRASVDGRVILAPSLDPQTRGYAKALAESYGVRCIDIDAGASAASILPAFDAALCASGTASLEAAIAGCIPIVVYRVGIAAELAARFLLKTEYVALPNVLLKRQAFTELVQRDVQPKRIGEALARTLRLRPKLLGDCAAVDQSLGSQSTPSRVVAAMLLPWLSRDARLRA
jgi:lipid-A-disaccharide synthase